MAFALTQIKVGSELAKALATQLGKTTVELDKMDDYGDYGRVKDCGNGQYQDGNISLVKLELVVDEIHGGLCKKTSEEGIAYAYIIDNGDGVIGNGDLFVYDYFKKMPWYRPDVSKAGFLKLFQPNNKQDLPANISNVVSQIEGNKGQKIDTAFTKPLECIGYSD